ncbi:MAG: HDIG domain-containing protein [Eubacteriaceae bacterium]|nr:HDIG domain-containing protein [Eubacteriaceae bacterium]
MHILLDKEINYLLRLLNSNNFKTYLCGGSLINILFDSSSSSAFDIITSIPAGMLINILKNAGYQIHVNENYISANKYNTTFNISILSDLDDYYKNIQFTPEYLLADCSGNIIDKYNVLNDIKTKTVKCINNVEICFSDKINKLRAIRLLSQLEGFSLDNSIINYIKNNPDIDGVSKCVIASEINKLLLGNNVKEALTLLQQTCLLKSVFPMLDNCACVMQHEWHTKDVFNHIVDVVGNTQADLLLRIAALFHDIAKPQCKVLDNGKIRFYGHDIKSAEMSAEILYSYGYKEDLIKKIYIMIKYHMKKKKLSDNELLEMMDDCKQADLDVDYIFKLQFADNAATLVTDRSGMYYNQDRVKELLVNQLV